MHKPFLYIAAFLGAVAVMIGAFASHGLKNILLEKDLQIVDTAVKYQFYHVFALLATGILYKEFPGKRVYFAGTLFCLGIFLFSGSLYAMSYFNYRMLEYKWIGIITPFGGLCFIAGWLMLGISFYKKN